MFEIANPLAWAQQHPSYFFKEGLVHPDALTDQLSEGVKALVGELPLIARRGEWRIVASREDWISLGRFPMPLDFNFHALTPFPELRVNAVRPEAVLAAFAQDVVIAGPEGITAVKGAVESTEDVYAELQLFREKATRVIAFRCSAA